MTTEEEILALLQASHLTLEQQLQCFLIGAGCIATLMIVPLVIHYAKRANAGGGE